MISAPGPLELLLILGIALLVLGPSRLPDAARSLGRGVRELRDALQGNDEDDDDDEDYGRRLEDDEDNEDDQDHAADDEDDGSEPEPAAERLPERS
jgi:sec-independent protein translocase protein TatA